MLVRTIGQPAIAHGPADQGEPVPGGRTAYVLEILAARFDIEGVTHGAIGSDGGQPPAPTRTA